MMKWAEIARYCLVLCRDGAPEHQDRLEFNFTTLTLQIHWTRDGAWPSMWKSGNQEIQKSRNREIQKSGNRELQNLVIGESRNLGIWKSRNLRIGKSINLGIKKSRNKESHNPEIWDPPKQHKVKLSKSKCILNKMSARSC